MKEVSEGFGMYVVFFFEGNDIAELFLKTGDVELSMARKLLQAPLGADITADYISADTGIIAPVMIIYSLYDVEPVILSMTGRGRIDSAS